MTEIRYSRGASKHDANPEQRTAEDFAAFADAVLADRAPRKGLQYVAAPFRANGEGKPHRKKDLAEPSQFIGFDFDGFSSAEDWHTTVSLLQKVKGFAYTTASHTPDAPRARAVLAATRPMDRTERLRVSLALQNWLNRQVGEGCIKFDESVYRAEQPLYLPPVNTQTYRFKGKPVDVDKVLAKAPPLDDGQDARQRAEAIATDDPVLARLQERDMLLREIEAGKYAVICPFEREHTERTSDTATVYMLPHFGGVKDGKFHCLHAHCQGRTQPDFLRAIDLDPAAVWRAHRAEQGAAQATTDEWPDPTPLPTGLPEVAPFDFVVMPAALQPWAQDIAERVQCPPDYVGMSVTVAASAALGRKIGVRPQAQTDWTEVANQFGLAVGQPGVLKSPAMEAALAPLKRLAAAQIDAFDLAQADFKKEQVLAKLRQEAAEKAVRARLKDSPGADVSGLLDVAEPEAPVLRRYLTNDTTAAALGELLIQNPVGLLVHRDEMVSLLRALDREDMAEARGFYLTAWNGNSGYTFDRIGRGLHLHIPAVCLSLLGSTQPARLSQYVRVAVEGGAGDDGLIQRFGLLVWPDSRGQWKEVDRWPDTRAKNAAFAVFRQLDELTPGQVGALQDHAPDGQPEGVPFLRFDDAALGLFREWRHDLETKLRSGELHPALEAHLAKYRKLVPALALLTHLIDNPTQGAIGEAALLKALAWAEYLETHARRAYGAVNNAEVVAAEAVLYRLRRGDLPPEFSSRDVWRPNWAKLTDRGVVLAGLQVLEDFGYLASRKEQTTGRPATVYMANPKVLQQ